MKKEIVMNSFAKVVGSLVVAVFFVAWMPVWSEAGLTIMKDLTDTNPPGPVQVGVPTTFTVLVTVCAVGGQTVNTLVVKDHFGADLTVVAGIPSQGVAVITTNKGRSAQNRLTWTVGSLTDPNCATLSLMATTDIDPGGDQEYTECTLPGQPNELNSGAVAKGRDAVTNKQVTAGSNQLFVTVVDPNDADGDGIGDSCDACPTDFGTGVAGCPQCSDGVDNDGDTFVDFPADLQCTGVLDDDESV